MRLGYAGVLLLTWAALALTAPWLPLDPTSIQLEHILNTPSSLAWLGHDDLGRDILARLVSGARTSFLAAVWVVTLSGVIGTLIGLSAAYLGGRWDSLVVLVIDIFMAFPGILLAIALAGILGPGLSNVIIALSVVGWVGFARLARAQGMSLVRREHVTAAQALGSSGLFTVRYHLLPLLAAPLLIEASLGIGNVVVAEAGLSFLGLGVQPPTASWGSMIRDGARYLLVAPHMVLAPGLALLAVVLAANRAGDRLRDIMDVRTETTGVK
jgi:peptide/nickel transport system permease protein